MKYLMTGVATCRDNGGILSKSLKQSWIQLRNFDNVVLLSTWYNDLGSLGRWARCISSVGTDSGSGSGNEGTNRRHWFRADGVQCKNLFDYLIKVEAWPITDLRNRLSQPQKKNCLRPLGRNGRTKGKPKAAAKLGRTPTLHASFTTNNPKS